MFNQKLKQEISALQAQLQALTAQESAVSRAMAMIRFDRDGKVVNANPLFLQTMGYSLADLQGKPHSQLCFPDYANSADYRAFWDRLRRGEPFSDRVRRRTADGREIWLEATYCPVRDAQGQIESFSKYASDITASVDAEVHNQARLNAINRAMAVIEFSPDGTVLDANENFLNVLGYRLDEVKGRHHRLFCDNEFAQSPEYQALWRQLARGEYYSGQIKRQAKNGAVRWLEASYNPVFAPDGKTVIAVVKFASDITERVESQRQESESARFAYEVAQETEALSSNRNARKAKARALPTKWRKKPKRCPAPAPTISATAATKSRKWPAASKKPGIACRRWASARSKSPRSCKPSRTLPTRPICWP